MGRDFDPDNVPQTLEEGIRNQREMDAARITNMLRWISETRKTPPEKMNKDDAGAIQQLSYYINDLYEYDDCRPTELKQYPYIDEDMRAYLREQSKHYRKMRTKTAAKNNGVKVAKIGAFAACTCIVVMLMAQSISTFAFGYDLLGNIGDWGKIALGISNDVVISQDNITVVKNGKTNTYKSIGEAVNDLGINILCPTYLPDGVYIDNIVYIDENSNVMVYFKFNDINYQIYITSNIDNDIMLTDYKTIIGNRECQITKRDTFQADFVEDSYRYSVISKNYDELIKIIENLKYN